MEVRKAPRAGALRILAAVTTRALLPRGVKLRRAVVEAPIRGVPVPGATCFGVKVFFWILKVLAPPPPGGITRRSTLRGVNCLGATRTGGVTRRSTLRGVNCFGAVRTGATRAGACLGATVLAAPPFLSLSSLFCAENSVVVTARSRAAPANAGNDTAMASAHAVTSFKFILLDITFPFGAGVSSKSLYHVAGQMWSMTSFVTAIDRNGHGTSYRRIPPRHRLRPACRCGRGRPG